MQADRATRIEKNVDRTASLLFATAAGYAAWHALAALVPVLERCCAAAGLGVLAWLGSFRLLRAIEPEPRKLPVPVFHVREIDEVSEIEPELLRLPASVVQIREIEPEGPGLPAPVVELREVDALAPEELLLTEPYQPAEEPLVLDDILGEIEADSRVVRLFDPAAMPTPAQLNDRIQRHLVRGAPPAPPHDASQALHDALAELRRSLR